jgi:hypothetical protein
VNDVKRLDKASFIKFLVTNTIKASTTSLPILGRGTCTFKGLLNKIKGKKVDLILLDFIIVKGFLVNIVLKALFYKKGLWIYSLDTTLYIKSEQENVMLLKLKCIYNFNFFKFKPFFTYLTTLFKVPTSAYKVLIYLTLK